MDTMNNDKSKPTGAPTAKEERLAAALRENLKRRKAQSRQRINDEKAPSEQTGAAPAPSVSSEKNKN